MRNIGLGGVLVPGVVVVVAFDSARPAAEVRAGTGWIGCKP
jgi:hypothetical protein